MQTHKVAFHKSDEIKKIERVGVKRTIEFPDWFSLFRIFAKRGDEKIKVRTKDFKSISRSEPQEGLVELVFSGCEKIPNLTVKIRIGHVREELRFAMEIDTTRDGSDFLIYETDFPVLPVEFAVGTDRIVVPSERGDILFDPATELNSSGFKGVARFVYPGRAAMQYTELYNRKEGVYFAAYNMGDESFDIGYEVKGSDVDDKERYDPNEIEEGKVNLFHRWYPYHQTSKWFTPAISVVLHKGDWHTGADIYRSIMELVLTKPEVPQWMRDGFHGWVKLGIMKFEGRPPAMRFTDLPKLLDTALEVGLPIMNLGGFSGVGFDTRYPDFWISEEVGTEEEFKQALKKIHAKGGKIMMYTNGRVADELSEFYKQDGDKTIVRNEDGTAPTELYPHTSVAFLVACPSEPYFRKYLAKQIEYLARLGADAIQIDQVSMAPPFNCFVKEHNHSKPSNNWIRGTEALCREAKLVHRSMNPDSFAWIEGVHELFGQYYEVNQCHGEGGCWIRRKPDGSIEPGYPEMFRYTFPYYIVTGVANNFQQTPRTMLEGKPFDANLSGLEDPEHKKLVKHLVALKKKYPEFYLYGTFKDTVGFELRYGKEGAVLTEGVKEPIMAHAIESEDGKRLLIGIWKKQEADSPMKVKISFDKKYRGKVRMIYPAKSKSKIHRRNGNKIDVDLAESLTILIKG